MIIFPIELDRQIRKLSALSQEVQSLERLLLQWFAARGFLDSELEGIINDILIDMQVQGCSPETTIELIKQEMALICRVRPNEN